MNNIWQHHDEQMMKLKTIYLKINRQLKNKLQEYFNRFKITSNNLYSIVDSGTKKQINEYIDEWRNDNFTGYFKIFASNLYTKSRITYVEVLELLIYKAYIDQQRKEDEEENLLFYFLLNFYYLQGQEEVNKTLPKQKRKSKKILSNELFLMLLSMPNTLGYVYKEYKDSITRYNAEQIKRQAVINIQQGKELDINSNEFTMLLKKQQNAKLNINESKISGAVDNTLIGMNNQAKLMGMTAVQPDAQVRFIAVRDEKTTDMCESLDGQIFNVRGWNEFKRYSASQGRIVKYRCKGLVLGLNLPPINDHFHWCRSTIIYVANKKETSYNEFDTFLRSKNYKYDGFEIDYEISATEYQQIPENIRMFLEKTGLTVEFDYNGKNSGYDRINNKILLKRNVTKGEMYHELGHAIYYNFNVKNMKEYQDIVDDIFKHVKFDKPPIIIKDRSEEFYALDLDYGNLDSFQLYLGTANNIDFVIQNIKNNNLPELFSEAYRKYHMKEKQLETLNNLIERIEKNAR